MGGISRGLWLAPAKGSNIMHMGGCLDEQAANRGDGHSPAHPPGSDQSHPGLGPLTWHWGFGSQGKRETEGILRVEASRRQEPCLASSHTLCLHQEGSSRLAPMGTQPPRARGPSCVIPARPPGSGVHSSASLGQALELSKDPHLPALFCCQPLDRRESSSSAFSSEEKAPEPIPARR